MPEHHQHFTDLVEQGLPVRRPDDGLVHLAKGGVEIGDPLDFPLLGAAFGDVPDEGDHPLFAIEHHHARADLHGESGSVLATMEGFEAKRSSLEHLCKVLHGLSTVLGVTQVEDALADQLPQVIPVLFDGPDVGFQDVALVVVHKNDVVGFAHEGFKPLRQVELLQDHFRVVMPQHQSQPRSDGQHQAHQGDSPQPHGLAQRPIDFSRVHLGHHEPARPGHLAQHRQHRYPPVVAPFHQALLAQNGPHRWQLRIGRQRQAESHRLAALMARLIQIQDLVPLPPHEQGFRPETGRGPELDQRIEEFPGVYLQEQCPYWR